MVFADQMAQGFISIMKASFVNSSALWLLIPLFLLWIILVVYFIIYSTESLGWNTSLGHGISMAWIIISLEAYLFDKFVLDWTKIITLFVFFAYAAFVIYMSFSHKVEEKIAFFLASPTIIFSLSWVAVVWSYDSLEINLPVLVDLIIIFAMLIGLVELIIYLRAKRALPEDEEELEEEPEELPEQ